MRVKSPLPARSILQKTKAAEDVSPITEDEVMPDTSANSKILESKKYDFLKELKGADWPALCDEVNHKQSKIKYISAFEQCKEFRIIIKPSSTPPVVTAPVVAAPVVASPVAATPVVAPVVTSKVTVPPKISQKMEIEDSHSTVTVENTRKSARNKAKVEKAESTSKVTDAEIKVSFFTLVEPLTSYILREIDRHSQIPLTIDLISLS